MKKDQVHSSSIDKFTEEITKAMDGTKAFDEEFEKSGY